MMMASWNDWWNDLTGMNQAFYMVAGIVSLLFLWQFLASLVGLAGHGGDVAGDVHPDVGIDAAHHDVSAVDAVDSVAAFQLLTVRSILGFLLLFFWAGALYMDNGKAVGIAMFYGLLWGLAGGLAVAVLVHYLRKLAETGTARLSTSVMTTGTVYLNIPAGGAGEVRVAVSGRITHVAARAVDGGAIPAGTPIRVVQLLPDNVVTVEPVKGTENRKEPS
ncbi:MAG: hypothetical protein NTV86_11020 [Planctomycetota bacterium]|nr:hypothetical protein [Planctomycetota bacterium]